MNNGLLAAGNLLASRAARTVRNHPKQITAVIAALLMCAGGGAFAVASLGPDAADLPVRQVLEAVSPTSLGAQTAELDAHSFTLFRTETTRSSDTAEALLARLGISDGAAAAFIRSNAAARTALLGRAGRTVMAEATHENRLQKLSARWIPEADGSFWRLTVELTPAGFIVRNDAETLSSGRRLASGMVRSSLPAAVDEAGLPAAVASQLAGIFSGELDVRSLRRGDRFAVVYETLDADGQTLSTGRVLAAELVRGSRVHQAIWFKDPGSQKGGYYRPGGDSLRKAFLESPVDFPHVSSSFAMRLHPILNSWRQHNGVDFAAPSGTPVRAVGDGVVEFAGTQSGYGNIVVLKHRNNQSTAYAHLSRIDVREGQSVGQGEFIGAVGSTGWATGPHLHFEFRVNGEYQDPAILAQQDGGLPISAASRPLFNRAVQVARMELSAASSVVQASGE